MYNQDLQVAIKYCHVSQYNQLAVVEGNLYFHFAERYIHSDIFTVNLVITQY